MKTPYKTVHCAICGKNERKQELYPSTANLRKINAKTFSARRTPDRMHYRFVVCKNCGLIFSDPILKASKILDLYKDSTFTYDVESTYLRKTYGYYLSRLVKKNKKVKLLDVGCGNGFFLEEAKEMGIDNVHGIEPGKKSAEKAPIWLRKRIVVDVLREKSFKPNSFDIITCFQTLDHIIDPNLFLKNIHKFLKKGGKTLFIQHNTNGLSVKVLGEKSPIFDIEHIYLFNKENIKTIFEKNGFKVKEVFDVKNSYPISYWTRMLPFPSPIKTLLLNTILKTPIGSIPITVSAGNLGIIAEKK